MEILIGVGTTKNAKVRCYNTETHTVSFKPKSEAPKAIKGIEYPQYTPDGKAVGVRKLFLVSHITNLNQFLVCDSVKDAPYCVDSNVLKMWATTYCFVNVSVEDNKLVIKGQVHKEVSRDGNSMIPPEIADAIESFKKKATALNMPAGRLTAGLQNVLKEFCKSKKEIIKYMVMLGRTTKNISFSLMANDLRYCSCLYVGDKKYRTASTQDYAAYYELRDLDFMNLTDKQAECLTIVDGETTHSVFSRHAGAQKVTVDGQPFDKQDFVFICQVDEVMSASNSHYGPTLSNLCSVVEIICSAEADLDMIGFNGCVNLRRVFLPFEPVEIRDYTYCSCVKYQLADVPKTVKEYGAGALMGVTYTSDILYLNDEVTTLKDLSAIAMHYKQSTLDIAYFGERINFLRGWNKDMSDYYVTFAARLSARTIVVRNLSAVSSAILDTVAAKGMTIIVPEGSAMLARIAAYELDGMKIKFIDESKVQAIDKRLQDFCNKHGQKYTPLEYAEQNFSSVTPADSAYSRLEYDCDDVEFEDCTIKVGVIKPKEGQVEIMQEWIKTRNQHWCERYMVNIQYSLHCYKWDGEAEIGSKVHLPVSITDTNASAKAIAEIIKPKMPKLAEYLHSSNKGYREVPVCAMLLATRLEFMSLDSKTLHIRLEYALTAWASELDKVYADFIKAFPNYISTDDAQYMRAILRVANELGTMIMKTRIRVRTVVRDIFREERKKRWKVRTGKISDKPLTQEALDVKLQDMSRLPYVNTKSEFPDTLPEAFRDSVIYDAIDKQRDRYVLNSVPWAVGSDIPVIDRVNTLNYLPENQTEDTMEELLNSMNLTLETSRKEQEKRGILRDTTCYPVDFVASRADVLKAAKTCGDIVIQHCIANIINNKLVENNPLSVVGFLLSLIKYYNPELGKIVQRALYTKGYDETDITKEIETAVQSDDLQITRGLDIYYNTGSHFMTMGVYERYFCCHKTYREQEMKKTHEAVRDNQQTGKVEQFTSFGITGMENFLNSICLAYGGRIEYKDIYCLTHYIMGY